MRLILKIGMYLVAIPAIVLLLVAGVDQITTAGGSEATARSAQLAERLGLEYGHEYRYRALVEAQRTNDIGSAGHYEYLDCDGDERGNMGWCTVPTRETFYYDNHNMTVTYAYRYDGGTMYARVARIAEGRVPALHGR